VEEGEEQGENGDGGAQIREKRRGLGGRKERWKGGGNGMF
jgi:hypothetical protein